MKRRAPRKTDAARGELGAWAYNAMVDLGLSDEQIAMRAGVSSGRIRKIMGGSERDPSARVLRAMHRYFMEIGAAANPPIPVDRPPGLVPDVAEAGNVVATPLASADLANALVSQATTFARMLEAALRRDQSVEARIRALEAEVRSLREQLGVEASPAQPTPHQTGESA